MSEGRGTTQGKDENTRRQNVKVKRDDEATFYSPQPLRELFGLHPATTEPQRYTEGHEYMRDTRQPRPGMERKRARKRKRRETEAPKDLRATVVEHRVTDNLGRETTCSSIFTHSFEAVSSHSRGIASAASPQDTASPVQSNDISSCSEVEVVTSIIQPKRRARKGKKRRITSKLSLSQGSTKHLHQSSQSSQSSQSLQFSQSSQSSQSSQLSHTLDSVHFVKAVVHRPDYTSSSSSSHSKQTTQDNTDGLDPSRCITRRDTSPRSGSVPASVTQAKVAQPMQHLKQSVYTLSHKPATGQSGEVKASTSPACRHTNSAGSGYTEMLSLLHHPTVAQHLHSHKPSYGQTQPQQSCVREDVITLTSSSDDSDPSVYYEAFSHLSFLDEPQPGPSGMQRPTGEAVQAARQKGDANTSSSSLSVRESDYTSHSFSSSDSSTFITESMLSKTVLNKQQQARNTQMQTKHEAHQEGTGLTKQRQTRVHSRQLACHPDMRQTSHHPRTSLRKPANTMSWEESEYVEEANTGASRWRPLRAQQAEASDVSSSTSDGLSEEEAKGRLVQGVQKSCVRVASKMSSSTPDGLSGEAARGCLVQGAQQSWKRAASRLSSSTVSSSSCGSSSDSSALLTKAGKGCIQTIGEVFQRYFGGTVEDKLTLLQKNDFNLLHCLVELQKASPPPQPHQPPAPGHRPSPRPPTP